MNDYSNYLGFLKIESPGIEDGILGARESAEVLLSFDAALRYYMSQEDSSLSKANFEIPVKIRKGSWEALIPHSVVGWIGTTAGLAGVKYATTVAGELAKNSVKDKNPADIVRASFKKLVGVIKIAKHLGSTASKDAGKGVKFEDNNQTVLIPNDDGIYLRTTRAELEAYLKTPRKMLEDIAHILDQDQERSFSFGEVRADGTVNQEKVTHAERQVFLDDEEEEPEQALFPELEHDSYITLEGSMTRGNKLTNTIGFQYGGHVLTCIPSGVPITAFRDAFFKDCTIGGRVSRLGEGGHTNAKRPKIIFDKLTPRESENPQTSIL